MSFHDGSKLYGTISHVPASRWLTQKPRTLKSMTALPTLSPRVYQHGRLRRTGTLVVNAFSAKVARCFRSYRRHSEVISLDAYCPHLIWPHNRPADVSADCLKIGVHSERAAADYSRANLGQGSIAALATASSSFCVAPSLA